MGIRCWSFKISTDCSLTLTIKILLEVFILNVMLYFLHALLHLKSLWTKAKWIKWKCKFHHRGLEKRSTTITISLWVKWSVDFPKKWKHIDSLRVGARKTSQKQDRDLRSNIPFICGQIYEPSTLSPFLPRSTPLPNNGWSSFSLYSVCFFPSFLFFSLVIWAYSFTGLHWPGLGEEVREGKRTSIVWNLLQSGFVRHSVCGIMECKARNPQSFAHCTGRLGSR